MPRTEKLCQQPGFGMRLEETYLRALVSIGSWHETRLWFTSAPDTYVSSLATLVGAKPLT